MIRVSQILFWFGLSIAASIALYHTSDRTHELDRQLREVDAAVEGEQQTIHVLKAEWVFLANPTRVETEAKKHLALRPTVPAQVIELASLDDALPTHDENMRSVAVTATPIATVKTSLVMSAPRAYRPARKIAASGHINDRMVIERTASVQSPDTIGSLLAGLGSRP